MSRASCTYSFIGLAHIRKTRSKFRIVFSDEGIGGEQIDMIIDNHDFSNLKRRVHSAAGIAYTKQFHAHDFHNTYRKCNLLHIVSLVKWKRPCMGHHLFPPSSPRIRVPVCPSTVLLREVGDFGIGDRKPAFISFVNPKASSKNDSISGLKLLVLAWILLVVNSICSNIFQN